MWQQNELRTEEDFGFNSPYLIACAAHRIKPIDYLSPEVKNDSKIREFMKKVEVLPDVAEGFGKAILDDPNHHVRIVEIEVFTKEKALKEKSRVVDWHWNSEVVATDDDLVKKFEEVVSGFLPSQKVEKATHSLLRLEEIENVNDLTALLVP